MSEFAELRSSHQGSSWLDDLVRTSLMAAERLYDGVPAERALRLHTGVTPSAQSTAKLVDAVQLAVARIAHHISDPNAEGIRVRKEHIDDAQVYVRNAFERTIEFGFVADPSLGLFPELSPSSITIAAQAASELLEVLPERIDDDRSVDAILSQSNAVMNAINDLTSAVINVGGASFEITGGGIPGGEAVMSGDQATVLRSSLKESRKVTRTFSTEGRLDGLRTKRRVFYLDVPTGEISGSFDRALYQTVLDNMNDLVEAEIVETRTVTKAGRRGRAMHRLVAIRPVRKLL